jgi:hypothetical protein
LFLPVPFSYIAECPTARPRTIAIQASCGVFVPNSANKGNFALANTAPNQNTGKYSLATATIFSMKRLVKAAGAALGSVRRTAPNATIGANSDQLPETGPKRMLVRGWAFG